MFRQQSSCIHERIRCFAPDNIVFNDNRTIIRALVDANVDMFQELYNAGKIRDIAIIISNFIFPHERIEIAILLVEFIERRFLGTSKGLVLKDFFFEIAKMCVSYSTPNIYASTLKSKELADSLIEIALDMFFSVTEAIDFLNTLYSTPIEIGATIWDHIADRYVETSCKFARRYSVNPECPRTVAIMRETLDFKVTNNLIRRMYEITDISVIPLAFIFIHVYTVFSYII